MRFALCSLCGVLLGCSTQHQNIVARQTSGSSFYLFWGAEDASSAYRFLSARVRLNEEIRLGGDYFLDLTGQIKQRGTNLVADLLGSTGGQGQLYRGAMTLEKPVFSQGGVFSGGVGPRYWFLLATNGDCRRILERVNATLGLAGPPFNHPAGLTNGPFYHPVANALPPATSSETDVDLVDPATGLPWGNRVVDPVTGLPLGQNAASRPNQTASRFQVSAWGHASAGGIEHGYYIIDTWTGDLWAARGETHPQKVSGPLK